MLLAPYIENTERYGKLICRIVVALGKTPPASKRDVALRDLAADVFDFLYEAGALIVKGKLDVAYPLARRAYESLSLMVACHLDPKTADRWIAGKQVTNADVRRVLDDHPKGESESDMKALYGFFSEAAHPNRKVVAHRHLGEGNAFVLGTVGQPSLAMLTDYALKTLGLWFWFGAVLSFVYADILAEHDPEFKSDYAAAGQKAREVSPWLVEQFDRLLAREQAEWRDREN